MRIALFQQDCVWRSPDANYQLMEAQLRLHAGCDLFVVPEMASTGFVTTPRPEQLESAPAVEARLLDLAVRYGSAICGSFAVAAGGDAPDEEACRLFNRAYFVTPEGEVHRYDKRHPFSPGGEDRAYAAGSRQAVVSYRGVRFLMCVCYDLRFPVWLRRTDVADYDVLLCVANWPAQRRLAWEVLLRARAIENQVYAVGVNRVGADPMCPYTGGTKAVHPYGHVLAECRDGEAACCTFEPDMAELAHYREKFPALADGDRFTLGL